MARAGLAFAALCVAGAASAAVPVARSPVGAWLTEDRDGVIEITPCGDALCGRIIGMSDTVRPGGDVPRTPAGAPHCGLRILRVTPEGDNLWRGRIENPEDGTTWRAEIWMQPDGLHLRGYVVVPLLGQTQLWTPFRGSTEPDCRMAR